MPGAVGRRGAISRLASSVTRGAPVGSGQLGVYRVRRAASPRSATPVAPGAPSDVVVSAIYRARPYITDGVHDGQHGTAVPPEEFFHDNHDDTLAAWTTTGFITATGATTETAGTTYALGWDDFATLYPGFGADGQLVSAKFEVRGTATIDDVGGVATSAWDAHLSAGAETITFGGSLTGDGFGDHLLNDSDTVTLTRVQAVALQIAAGDGSLTGDVSMTPVGSTTVAVIAQVTLSLTFTPTVFTDEWTPSTWDGGYYADMGLFQSSDFSDLDGYPATLPSGAAGLDFYVLPPADLAYPDDSGGTTLGTPRALGRRRTATYAYSTTGGTVPDSNSHLWVVWYGPDFDTATDPEPSDPPSFYVPAALAENGAA